MKLRKTLLFAFFVIMLVTVLTSCSNIKCMIPIGLHTYVTDEAIDPTCAAPGYTEGLHCADCGKVFVAQSIISKLPHTKVDDAAVEPTCAKVGLTSGSHCSECGFVFVKQEEIAKKPHNEVIVPGRAATCTTDGYTESRYCADCKEKTVTSTKIPKGHSNVIVFEAVDSTCASVGSTAGKFCTDCMTMFEGSNMIPKKDHIGGEWIVEKPATEFESGIQYQICTECGDIASESIIPQIAYFEYSVNATDNTCTITGVTVYADIELYIPDYIGEYKVTSIGNNAFAGQTQIIAAYIPSSVISIGDYAFYACTGLANISIPEGVASIGCGAFYECSGLTSILLPNSITMIGDFAFYNCSSLINVYYRGIAEMWDNVDIGEHNDAITSVNNIHYYSVADPSAIATGIFNKDGKLYLYVNGERCGAGLIVFGGAYYYVHTAEGDALGELVVDQTYWVTVTSNLMPQGYYTFDAYGRIIDPYTDPGDDTVEINRYWHFVDGVPTVW